MTTFDVAGIYCLLTIIIVGTHLHITFSMNKKLCGFERCTFCLVKTSSTLTVFCHCLLAVYICVSHSECCEAWRTLFYAKQCRHIAVTSGNAQSVDVYSFWGTCSRSAYTWAAAATRAQCTPPPPHARQVGKLDPPPSPSYGGSVDLPSLPNSWKLFPV